MAEINLLWIQKRKWSWKMIWTYFDNLLHIFIVIYAADVLQRIFLMCRELLYYSQYYLPSQRLWTTIQRSFSYNISSVILVICVIFSTLLRCTIVGQKALPPAIFFAFMPVYWIHSIVEVDHSTLSYTQWIRGRHGLDYAAGLAYNYFHGYLNLSLPSRNSNEGLLKRMQIYEDVNNATFGIDRLVILIPDEMFVNGIIESENLEQAKPIGATHIPRAGVNRTFNHAVYRLKKRVNGKIYYFVLEGATPMLTFFESINSTLTATWQMKELKREIWLKFYYHLKDLLESWPETRKVVKLIKYKSHKENGELVDIGDLLLSHIDLKKIEN